jgi:hypothetical protein
MKAMASILTRLFTFPGEGFRPNEKIPVSSFQRKKVRLESKRERLLREIAEVNRDLVNLEEELRKIQV